MASDDRFVSQHLDRDLDHCRHADSPDAMVDQGQQKRCFAIFLKLKLMQSCFQLFMGVTLHVFNVNCKTAYSKSRINLEVWGY